MKRLSSDSLIHALFSIRYTRAGTYPIMAMGFVLMLINACIPEKLPIIPPVLNTSSINSITETTAGSGGNITSNGGGTITERGVCWSESTSPTTTLSTKTLDGTGVGTFSSSITGLTPGVTYFVRAYATNSSGTAYGNEISFITLSYPVPLIGLVAYYPFNGNANDESGNGNHGTNHGASLTNDKNGNNSSAYSFNGSTNYIELNQAFDLAEGTYSIWINARTFPIWESIPIFFDMGTFFGTDDPSLKFGSFSLNVANKGGADILYVRVGSMNGNCSFETPFIKNSWNHVVLSKDVNLANVYLNSILVATKNIDIAVSGLGNPNAIIGVSRMKDNRFFDGNIDEIRIYNRVLNEQEIQSLYNE